MIRKTVSILFIIAALLSLCACDEKNDDPVLPDVLRGKSFVYDELDHGEGGDMYTLRFSDSGYKMFASGGRGIVSHGSAAAKGAGALELADGDGVTEAAYTGSAFEKPSVTVTKDGRTMKFALASENAEDVYLSFLGTYCDESAVLILDRWNEWFFIDGEAYFSGSYDIYSDGTVELRTGENELCRGKASWNGGEFDQSKLRISFELGGKSYETAYTSAPEQYDAAHAMGTYTLSLYPSNVFEIHGMDGFLKALGTLENNKVTYFLRSVTNNAEKNYGFEVAKENDTYYFPETTPLLPRSGNISKETGFGSYWGSGTKLEFIKKNEVVMPKATELFERSAATGKNNFPDFDGGLKAVMPSTGTAKPLAVLVDFPDQHHPRHVTAGNVEKALFSLDDPNSLASFYYRSSYGRLTVDGKVYGWCRTKLPRSEYGTDTEIMREVIGYYIENEGLKLSDHDADGDGTVDSLYVLWAGNMEAGTGIWDSAYRSTWVHSPNEWDGRITGYIFVPGSTIWSSVPPLKCNTNSLIHETGHLLGLNDYYSYDTSERSVGGTVYTGGALEGGLGGMDMMDTNIGDHNVFSKWLLGWAEPEFIDYDEIKDLNGKTFTLKASALRGDGLFIKLRDEDTVYTEWLVVEAVSPVCNFSEYTRLTRPVVRLLHVDASLAESGSTGGWRGFGFKNDNSYTSTKFIGIIEADGRDDVLNFVPSKQGEKLSYEESDYFTAGDRLAPDTYPNTNAYDGYGNATVPTGLVIEIVSVDPEGTAEIRLSYSGHPERLTLESVSPDPVAVPYKEGGFSAFDPDNAVFSFEYDRDIAFTDDRAKDMIKVYSDLLPVEGYNVTVEGKRLTVAFPGGLEGNRAYTVVIPAGVLCGAGDNGVKNNYNCIYGFISSKQGE